MKLRFFSVRSGFLAVLILLFSAGGHALPQDEQQPDQELQSQLPTFRTGINFVQVDIIVTDGDGNPVVDLRADEFEILEDGVPQTIDSFRLVNISGGSDLYANSASPIRSTFDEERESSREDVRLFAIFFDDYHVRYEMGRRLQKPLIDFIQTQLRPSDMLGIMHPLTPLSDVRMTRDRNAVISDIRQFEGRKYVYEPRNLFEQQYAYYSTSVVERIRNQVSLSALEALVTHLGGLRDGRKSIVLLSEGYTNYLPPQLRSPVAGMVPRMGSPNSGNPFLGNSPQEQTAALFANSELSFDLREVFDAANRSNSSIYALDPRGLAAFEFDISQPAIGIRTDATSLQMTTNSLRTLSEETDGLAIVDQNDFEPGLRQMMIDSSVYYLVGYDSTEEPSDGEFHEIEVRVKRDGLKVRARRGYWAASAEDVILAEASIDPGPPEVVEEAFNAIAEQSRDYWVRTWIGSKRGDNGKTRVTFIWEADPSITDRPVDELELVSLTASNETGDSYYRGRVPDAKSNEETIQSEMTSQSSRGVARSGRVVFDVDPGAMHTRVAVEGVTGNVLDREIREVNIPDFTSSDISLSTPVVFRARNALEMRSLVSNFEAMPTVGRIFRRTERLLLRFEVYAQDFSPSIVTASLLNRKGGHMVDLPVQLPLPGRPYQVDLPLSSLAVGEYLVEITAVNGEREVKALVAFRMRS